MASPHVAGVAALILAAQPRAHAGRMRTLLVSTGDCPDGTTGDAGCGGSSQWGNDPDGIAEPLVNALRRGPPGVGRPRRTRRPCR